MADKELLAATNEDIAASISIADDEDDGVDLPSLASDQLLSRKAVVLDLPMYQKDALIDIKFGLYHGNGEIPNVTKPSEEFDGGLLEQTDGDEDSSSLRLYQQLYGYATQGKIDSFKDTIERKLEADEVHDPNARVRLLSRLSPHKNTFLHIAASFGHAKLAAEIIHLHKPLLFEKNFEGDTALHITAKAGDLDTANTLLREALGAENADEVFMLLTLINDAQNTPLHEALIHGHQSVAKCLIEAYPAFTYLINKEEKSPLYLAAEEGFDEIVKLINKKAVEKKPEVCVNGKSPLHAAILGHRNNGTETFESPKDEKGRTPLHCAASIGYLEGVRFLLGRRLSDSHQMDHGGNFPIHSASSKGHIKIVKELLRHCPDSKELKNI
ncbi:serine/threonine-protein phosphatase 6 regulatory ankyrin repeat subunit B-like [Prunus dulcis]|uniref:serine/threonine-protein phosphatase 6 regulatory ankyrin repeat subunit B-like n=1 Tax=Prunus dulcis TaxID=3755 RepID=UPI0014831C3F|nr:serine/threonine-protein phosphatase 6 regulatory ankyrin repeat subunit B-like [Prunus dulcis]